MKNRFRIKDYLPVVIMLCCAAFVGLLTALGIIDIEKVPDIARDRKWLMLAILLGLFTLKGMSGIPIVGIVLAASAVFPPVQSVVICLAGAAVMLSVSYFMGLKTNTAQLNEKIEKNPKVRKYYGIARKYGAAACFLLHLMGLSTELLGVLFGAMRLKFLPYLLTSLVGLTPCLCSFIFIGKNPDPGLPVFWIMLAVYFGSVLLAALYARRLLRKEKEAESAE